MTDISTLSSQEQERLQAEETFRWEVRRSLEASTSKKKPSLVTLLSSPLALFLMSSVLLPAMIWVHGLISAYFAEDRKRENERETRVARVEKLDTEIAFRYSKAMLHLQLGAAATLPLPEVQVQLEKAVLQMTASPRDKHIYVLYEEFGNSSGYALLSELRDHLIRAGFIAERRTQPGTIRYVLLKLSKLEDEVQLKKLDANSASAALKLAMNLPPVEQYQKVPISRWRKGFGRTDCLLNETTC